MRRLAKGIVRLVALVGVGAVLAGCDYTGLNDFQLPGTGGHADGAYEVTIHMQDVGDLVPNNPVRVGDTEVGSIRSIRLDDWTAVVTVGLDPEITLPANTVAKVGQVSLLGAKYIELAPPPAGEAPQGRLAQGSVIDFGHSGAYPETEEVLAATATLLNGGSLQQLKTISYEVNKALDGRTGDFRDLLTQLNTFARGLDEQKADIIRAIDGLNRLSGRIAEQRQVIDTALDTVPPALAVLEDQRKELTHTLSALSEFGNATDEVVQRSADDIATNVANLEPALRGLADAGTSLTGSLGLLGTILFPLKNLDEVFQGDYINFYVTLDVTLSSLDQGLLTGTPFQGKLGAVETALQHGGATSQVIDPLIPRIDGVPLLEPGEMPPGARNGG
ncbi:MCE family protein [Pseudonocardia sp. RS010]|uniref:MCE family protein n=1 Tax=Pseudonocardia sp. RS010 TaxID=3385979 RepID=UPI0039A29CC6